MRIADDSRLSDKRVTEWFILENARREDARAAKPAPPGTKPIITISRQHGVQGHAVAQRASEWLGQGWRIWDREIIDAVAESAQCRRQMVEALDEHAQHWVDNMTRNLFNVRFMESVTYRKHLVHVLLALAQQGHMILVGRGANFVVPGALNIRLVASLEYRISIVMEQDHLTREQATRRIHDVEHERTEFTHTVFGRNIDDPGANDMVLRMDSLGLDTAAAAIAAAAHSMFTEI